MNIRKRVKINVQSSKNGGASIDAKKLSRAKLSLFRDDEDDDDYEEAPARLIKKKDQQESKLPTLEQSHTNYDDFFTRKSAPSGKPERIMNLEDMAEDESNEFANTVTKKENDEARIRKPKLQHGNYTQDEKVYVSLLDPEDKLELMDALKRQGGPGEEQDGLDSAEPDLLDDGQLPLSSREVLLNQSRRKQAIEEALKVQDKEASDAWEIQMLNKGAGQSHQPPLTSVLPRLYSSDTKESNTVDGLSQAIASITLRKQQLEKQLKVLRAQRADIHQQQLALTHRLHQWPKA